MEDQANLRGYWRILINWWWLLGLFLVVGVSVAGTLRYLDNRSRTPLYHSTAKLLVEGGQSGSVTGIGDVQGQQLALYYDDLVRTRPLLDIIAQKLQVPAGDIANAISVKRPRTFIEITATHRDPAQASKIANVTAQTLIEDLRNRQLTQIAVIQGSLTQYGIVQDPAITAAQVGRLSNLSVAEAALPPGAPFNKGGGLAKTAALGAILSLLAGLGVIFLREHLDDKVKSMEDLKAMTGLITLGAVMQEPSQNGTGPAIYAEKDLNTRLAESYKSLRTSLEFATLGSTGMRVVLITSSSPGEGKTTTAANLATSFARSGKSVILLDGDLRRPSIHRLFKLQKREGLTDVLLGHAKLDDVLAPSGVAGLRILPAGPLPPDPTDVLRAARMNDLVKGLKDRADLIIIDSPPLLVVSDPLLLVSLSDAVLMVVDIDGTRRDVVKRGVETLSTAKPQLAALVLNKMTARSGHGYYYYYYYYQYSGYYNSGSENGDRPRRKGGRPIWSRLTRRNRGRTHNRHEAQPGANVGA